MSFPRPSVPGTILSFAGAGVEAPPAVVASPFVRFTVTGASFAPAVELRSGSSASVTWVCEETADTATGIAPTFAFGSVATRHVRMSVTAAGASTLDDVTTLNLGYDDNNEGSPYSLGAGYNHSVQSVTLLEGLALLTGLVRFAAESTPLAQTLDFTGKASLTNIEVWGSVVTGVVLTGCSSLQRLNVEQANLTALDLNPVAATVKDLRLAAQQGGALTFTPVTSDFVQAVHFCDRGQVATSPPPPSRFPAVLQWWDFVSGQSGALSGFDSPVIFSLQAQGNAYTSADLTNVFPAGRNAYVDLSQNHLASVVLTGCSGIVTLILDNNLLNQAAVDGVLAAVDGFGTSGGTLNIAGTGNAAPSATGLGHATNLTGRGWTVTHL